MEVSLCTLDKYFSILNKIGYVDYTTVLDIVTYLALQEIYHSWDWSEEHRRYMNQVLNDLESKVCLISACTPCLECGGIKQSYHLGDNVFGFYDMPTSSDSAVVREIWKAMENYNLFMTL